MKEKIASSLIIVILPLIIIFGSFRITLYNNAFYYSEFEKNLVYQKFDKETVNSANKELLNYFQNKNYLRDTFFNEREKLHLKDVKQLIETVILSFNILVIIFTLALYYLYYNKRTLITKSLILSSILSIIVLVAFGILSLFNFSEVFLKFHYLTFSNNLWQLNPEKDNLIIMFPEIFFYNFLKRLLIVSLIFSIILLLSLVTTLHINNPY